MVAIPEQPHEDELTRSMRIQSTSNKKVRYRHSKCNFLPQYGQTGESWRRDTVAQVQVADHGEADVEQCGE